jgi:hypothetical protein
MSVLESTRCRSGVYACCLYQSLSPRLRRLRRCGYAYAYVRSQIFRALLRPKLLLWGGCGVGGEGVVKVGGFHELESRQSALSQSSTHTPLI